MREVKGIGRRTQLLHDLTNRGRYWELKEEAEDRIVNLSIEHKEEIHIFPKSMNLLISNIIIIIIIIIIISTIIIIIIELTEANLCHYRKTLTHCYRYFNKIVDAIAQLPT